MSEFFTAGILMLVFILSGGFFAAGAFGKRMEAATLFWMLGSILWLYIFAVFHQLETGKNLLLGLSGILYLAGLPGVFKNFSRFRQNFLTPGFVVLIIWTAISFYSNANRQLCNWDEISYWGLAPKLLWESGLLSCETNQYMVHSSYVPGMALFHWLNLGFYGAFSEPMVLSSNDMFLSVLLIYMLQYSVWRKWKIPAGVMLFAPALAGFFFEMLRTCYADVPLSLLCGAGMFTILNNRKHDWVFFIKLFLIVAALFLIKNPGNMFALLLLLFAAAEIIALDLKNRKELFPKLAMLLVVAVSFLIIRFSWKYLLDLYSCPILFSGSQLTIKRAFYAFFLNEPSYTYLVLWRTIRFLFNPVPFFYPAWYAALAIFYLVVKKKLSGAEKIKWRVFGNVIFWGAIGYLSGLFCYYLFEFTEYEALNIASLDRYWNTFLLMSIYAFAAWSFSGFGSEVLCSGPQKSKKTWLKGTIFAILSLAVLWSFFAPYRIGRYGLIAQWRQDVRDVVQKFNANFPDSTLILVTYQGYGMKNFLLQYEIPYNFINLPSSVRAFKTDKNGEMDTVISVEEWRSKLANVDIVYLDRIDSRFKEEYQSVFKNGKNAIKRRTFYRVTPELLLEEATIAPTK